jgi:hypothetical protein
MEVWNQELAGVLNQEVMGIWSHELVKLWNHGHGKSYGRIPEIWESSISVRRSGISQVKDATTRTGSTCELVAGL